LSSELDVVRTCALLHDIGKLECWAKRKRWSEHIFYTHEFVKECLGDELAVQAMRHHVGASYPEEYRPKSYVERIVCLADNFASGADRREVPSRGPSIPSPPVKLTHVLSGSTVRRELEANDLVSLSREIASELGDLKRKFSEDPRATYFKIFDVLCGSGLRFVPADTREPINDVSLWDHLKLTAAFSTCIYLDGWKGDNPEKYEFALLSGDADRISSFIGESLRLPDLNARSALISNATDRVRKFLRGFLGPECVLFAAGGSFLALCPRGLAEKALEGAKKAFEEVTEGRVSITVSYVVASGDEIQSGFGEVWKSSQQRMRLEKSRRVLVSKVTLEEGTDACDICKVRPWTKEDGRKVLPFVPPRRERLCNFCWDLREKGKGVWLNDLKDKSNFVACIKADGDSIGRVLAGKTFIEEKKASTPSRISTLSDLIHRTCEKDFEEIVAGFKGKKVFAGGDDLLAFVPGEVGLEVARHVALKFKDEMAGKCTMSAGVAIFHYRLPVYVGVEAAGYLLSRAKEEGKNRVAFAVIGGSGVTISELEQKVRPMSWNDLDELLSIVDFMREEGFAASQLRKVASVAVDDPVRAEVLIKCLMGRERIGWVEGKTLLSHLESGLLGEAFLIYNLFRGS